MSGKVTIASSRNFGQGLYKGHNPSFFSIYPWIDVDYLEPWMDKMLAEHNVTEQQIDGYFRKVAFEYIQAEPAKAVVATALKMAVFFSPYPTPLGRATLVEEGDGIVLRNFRWRNLPIGLVAMCHTLLVWAGVALWMRFEKSDAERELGYLLIWTTLAFLVVYSLLYSELRYRLPIDLLLTIVAGQGFSRFLLDKR
jgi:hypothetical protein